MLVVGSLKLAETQGHEFYMREALAEAREAYAKGEVPIGAVIVRDGEIIARAHNLKETWQDPTAHAEILVIQQAVKITKGWRLSRATLYATIEPCPMCAGAIVQARIQRLVYGSRDPKAGAAGTLLNLVQFPGFNHQVEVIGGVLEEECGRIMSEFFRRLRD
ncbi:MAG: tRNA adenosine(34) deaminase TadA [Firmicutes bacterium]|nr:tRNA adenosine(34) deaminase TadA [Bacillota bacterium]